METTPNLIDILAALEEEVRKDLESVIRIRKVLSLSRQAEASKPLVDDEDDDDIFPATLRGAIEIIVNADPSARWTTQKILSRLQQIKYPLRAKKPIYSVAQALLRLSQQNRIIIIHKGEGSAPNVYNGRLCDSATVSQTAHSRTNI